MRRRALVLALLAGAPVGISCGAGLSSDPLDSKSQDTGDAFGAGPARAGGAEGQAGSSDSTGSTVSGGANGQPANNGDAGVQSDAAGGRTSNGAPEAGARGLAGDRSDVKSTGAEGTAGSASGAGNAGGSRGDVDCGGAVDGMVCIPGATFVMGSALQGSSYHDVTVQTFQIMVHEVTIAEYAACVDASVCAKPDVSQPVSYLASCNEGVPDRDNYPVNCVSRRDAETYCRWVGARMITEEEWEYAAFRGGIRLFPWGNTKPNATRLNLAGEETGAVNPTWGNDGYVHAAPVGSFPLGATPDGILDLVGNVWEMVSNHFCDFPVTACTSCPTGEVCPDACDADCKTNVAVHRGASWAEGPLWESGRSWVNWRGASEPDFRTDYFGFRCGRSVH